MSTIYKWMDSETVVTSTTTANLLRTSDPVLVASLALGNRTGQATVGTVATLWPVTSATTGSTATTILPYGVISVQASSVSTTQAWLLSTATQTGQCVTIFYNSTSTSSQNVINTASTANMTFASTETYAGTTLTFNQVPKAYFELTAVTVSTAGGAFINPNVWMVTGRSAAGTLCT